MKTDESLALTQTQLASEGSTMKDLLENFRGLISSIFIDDSAWVNILECAHSLPIMIGAQPFGFEFPLHTRAPNADFGATLESETSAAEIIQRRAKSDRNDEVANALSRLFKQMDVKNSQLRGIVGHKLMLEFDIGTKRMGASSFPGMFLRPDQHPIVGSADDRFDDVRMVAESLTNAVGWQISGPQLETLRSVYIAQPDDVRIDSIGIFPARSRAIRLGIMGFESRDAICNFLEKTAGPRCSSSIDSIVTRFSKRLQTTKAGLSIDVEENGLGSTLGLTFIVKQRYTNHPRYWLDEPGDWNPFLNALRQEELFVPEKIQALGDWVVKPSSLFGRSGRFFLLRGIHHIKLVIRDGKLDGAKAYVFLVLSAA